MKVLYISPYLGFSGYSTAARGYVRALHKQGVDLVLRSVKYDDGQEHKLEQWERELFCKASEGVDIIIQHLTANELAVQPDGQRNAKHVAMIATETDLISQEWTQSLNRMDAVITFCQMSADAIKKAGVTAPIHVVPHTFDMNVYKEKSEPFNTERGVPLSGSSKPCIFYNISQISNKKGIDKLIRAYYGAFRKKEPVTLLLKGYIGQMKRVNEEQYGKGIVSTIWGGPKEFLSEDEIYLVQHSVEPVFGMKHPHPYMFTSEENWAEPSVTSMIKAMRCAYQDYEENKLRSITNIERFDDNIVGPILTKILVEVSNDGGK